MVHFVLECGIRNKYQQMKHKNYIFSIVGLSLLFGVFSFTASAESIAQPVVKEAEPHVSTCAYTQPESKTYDAKVVAIRRKLKVEVGEHFRVKVFMKNIGNTPWFSDQSGCEGPKMFLGTDKVRDRASEMYTTESDHKEVNNWMAPNRIRMDQTRVNPGEIASFTFWNNPGSDEDILKEYYTPLIDGERWIDNAGFSFEVIVGELKFNADELRQKLSFKNSSGSVADIDLNAEKLIKVDLSEQKLWIYLGDEVIREFGVSTGKPSTPTPPGNYSIMLKQTVRVGNEAPHYVMPNFMMFKGGGYGFHALPSLKNDGGLFWTEARNHIGRPVSHGCVRILPEDAVFLYDFSDVGTKVEIVR